MIVLRLIIHPLVLRAANVVAAVTAALAVIVVVHAVFSMAGTGTETLERYDAALDDSHLDRLAAVSTSPGYTAVADLVAEETEEAPRAVADSPGARANLTEGIYAAFVYACHVEHGTAPLLAPPALARPYLPDEDDRVAELATPATCAPVLKEKTR